MISTFATDQDEIARRVKPFQTHFTAYHAPDYKEAHDRDLIQRQTLCPAVSGIDALVAARQLYGLTDDEIKIMEGRA